jgi:chorismate mutase
MKSLDVIIKRLESLEDEIIHALMARAEYRLNSGLYIAKDNKSTLDLWLTQREKTEAFFGRFSRPEERPFHPGPPSPRYFEPEPNRELRIRDYDLVNLTPMILQAYIRLLPEICQEGDDGEYDLCLEKDAEAVKIISRRIHFGAFFVAERKYREKPRQYGPFIKAKDEQGLMGLITRKQVEETILQRVYKKTKNKREKREGKTVDPNAVSNFYRDTIIGLTKEGEIRYLLNRD